MHGKPFFFGETTISTFHGKHFRQKKDSPVTLCFAEALFHLTGVPRQTNGRLQTADNNMRRRHPNIPSSEVTPEELILDHTVCGFRKVELSQLTESFNVREVRTSGPHWVALYKKMEYWVDPSKLIMVCENGEFFFFFFANAYSFFC